MKTVLIFPWARALRNGQESAKNYPYWSELVQLLKNSGFKTIQVSRSGEREIGAEELLLDKSLTELKTLVKNSDYIITVDSFAGHLCWLVDKQAIVLFGLGDPEIFGHKENINLLKDKKYLRPNQFDQWEGIPVNRDAFVKPEEVVKYLDK